MNYRAMDSIYLKACMACAGLTAVAYFLAFSPAVEARRTVLANREQLATQSIGMERSAQLLRANQRDLNLLQKDLSDNPAVFTRPGKVSQRVAELCEIASKAGATVEDVRTTEPPAGPRGMTPIKCSISGSFPSLVSFLSRARQTCPDVCVKSFEFRARPSGTEFATCAQLELLWCSNQR